MSDCKQKYIEWSSENGAYCGEYEGGLLAGRFVGTEARTEFNGWEAAWNARQDEIDQLKYERDAFQEFHRDCKAEIDQLKAEKAGLEKRVESSSKQSR